MRKYVPVWIPTLVVSLAVVGFALAQSGSSSQKTQTTQTKSGNASSSARASASSNGFGSGSGMAATPNYAVVFVPEPRFEAITDLARATLLQEQMRYHAKLAANLKLLHSGPWRDHPGGLATLLAKSDEEAQAIVDQDPAVRAGFYAAEVRAWNVTVSAAGPSRGGG